MLKLKVKVNNIRIETHTLTDKARWILWI